MIVPCLIQVNPLNFRFLSPMKKLPSPGCSQQLDPASGGEPQTRGDLTNNFNRLMNRAKHEKALELIEILEQNFLQDEDGKWYVPDHNKASDLEKVRQRSLLKEFNEYADSYGPAAPSSAPRRCVPALPTASSARIMKPSSRLPNACRKTCCAKTRIC